MPEEEEDGEYCEDGSQSSAKGPATIPAVTHSHIQEEDEDYGPYADGESATVGHSPSLLEDDGEDGKEEDVGQLGPKNAATITTVTESIGKGHMPP